MLFDTVIIHAAFFFLGDITALLFGAVIIWYGYNLCSILRYSGITAVLFRTVDTCAAFFGTVISLWCYSVWLILMWHSSAR